MKTQPVLYPLSGAALLASSDSDGRRSSTTAAADDDIVALSEFRVATAGHRVAESFGSS